MDGAPGDEGTGPIPGAGTPGSGQGTATPGSPGDGAPVRPDAPDVARRDFFRHFMNDAVQTAATIVGAAGAIQRSSADAAGQLLGLAGVVQGGTGGAPSASALLVEAPPPAVPAHSPFRFERDRLVILDQREPPEAGVEAELRTAAEVGRAIRDGALAGPATIAQAAAYGLALTAERSRASQVFARRAIVAGSAQALQNAAPVEMQLQRAVAELLAAWEELGEEADDGDRVADRIREAADAIAMTTQLAHARLAASGGPALPSVEEPLRVLTLGHTGPLACGGVGSAFGVIREAAATRGRAEVFVLETRPGLSGARLATWEFDQAGIPHTLVPDAAAGWLMAEGRVDVVLVGASRIAANGDVAAILGTYPLAVLASRHHVPFLVCAPVRAVDLATADGAALFAELRPPETLTRLGELDLAPAGTTALAPVFDVTPAGLVTGFITDQGLLDPPFEASLGRAAGALAPLESRRS